MIYRRHYRRQYVHCRGADWLGVSRGRGRKRVKVRPGQTRWHLDAGAERPREIFARAAERSSIARRVSAKWHI